LQIISDQKIFFHRSKYFSSARSELSRKRVAMQKFPIVRDRSGSHRKRSRDRSEISRIAPWSLNTEILFSFRAVPAQNFCALVMIAK